MTSTERTYTLPEARRLLAMEACQHASGHAPDDVIRNGTGTAVAAFCDCGHVRWTPVDAPLESLRDEAARIAEQLASIGKPDGRSPPEHGVHAALTFAREAQQLGAELARAVAAR
jgi:cytosine/adenosine deaminase-related metal-dependent hydrolase